MDRRRFFGAVAALPVLALIPSSAPVADIATHTFWWNGRVIPAAREYWPGATVYIGTVDDSAEA